ncbi:MAG: beta-ketoacyl-[acyl-carrier-protein] synthase family protein [Victivallales bacterium]
MEKVAITGRGLITPLGNGLPVNEEALRQGRSGTVLVPAWQEMGLDSQVAGLADEDPECDLLDPKIKRFASPNSRMAVAALAEALKEAGLTKESIKNYKVAIINGCAGSAYEEIHEGARTFEKTGKCKKVKPLIVPRVMASSAVSIMSIALGVTGETYDISSACTSGAHAILLATRLVNSGLYDIVISGGSEELNWVHALGFNSIRALSTAYNDKPSQASRPFDITRDGFVIAEGAGIVILEKPEHAKARGVKPVSYISGLAANSNAIDMVVPDAAANAEVMKMAVESAGLVPDDIDYINTHGTATPVGDPVEMDAIQRVFGSTKVAINSTKSMTGHMIGATGAAEVIFTSMMLEKGFLSPSINLENPEPAFAWADIVRETRTNLELRHAMSNSFGFGGSNACLVISKADA